MATAFISYGGPDETFAAALNKELKKAGIETFFFPEDARPGDKLHHMMRDGINTFDKVIFICSQNSLTRNGVINELEETLQREAREGGREILIPISIDNYVHDAWQPARPGLKLTVLDRVIGDFRRAATDKAKFRTACKKLAAALHEDAVIEHISFHSTLHLDMAGEQCRVLLERNFIARKPVKEILYTNMTSSGRIVPLSCNKGQLSCVDVGGNKTITVTMDEPLPVNETFTHQLEIEHLQAFTEAEETYTFTGLHTCRRSSLDILFPAGRPVKQAIFESVFKNQVTPLPENIFISQTKDKIAVWVDQPKTGTNYIVKWQW